LETKVKWNGGRIGVICGFKRWCWIHHGKQQVNRR
jgi:hypothetical protein